MTDSLEIHYDGDGSWAALYVNGKLVPETVGDVYHAEEEALRRSGVHLVHESDFLMGGDQCEDAAETLKDIDAYTFAKQERLEHAQELRDQAAEILAVADRLEAAP